MPERNDRDKKKRNARRNARADHAPGTRSAYEAARRRILATQDVCGICGQPVDKNLRPPSPGAPTIDHIIPLSKGGSLLDPDNLQLAHLECNRRKAARTFFPMRNRQDAEEAEINNRDLPQSFDWINYRSKED